MEARNKSSSTVSISQCAKSVSRTMLYMNRRARTSSTTPVKLRQNEILKPPKDALSLELMVLCLMDISSERLVVKLSLQPRYYLIACDRRAYRRLAKVPLVKELSQSGGFSPPNTWIHTIDAS